MSQEARERQQRPKNADPASSSSIPTKRIVRIFGRELDFRWVLALILLLGFLSKAVRLGVPDSFYFDEVYHGFTGGRYLHGDPDAYNPWAKPPQGRAFEWTHPPLAKLFMAGSMGVFGENGFGWRIGSVVFGTGAIAMAAFLALELFGSPAVALLAAALLSIEGLFFVQSRVAMNDAYFIFFMLSALLAYVRWKRNRPGLKRLYLTGTLLGLALATKWTTLYVFLILGLDLARDLFWTKTFRRDRALLHLPIALGLIPVALYIASYLQYFLLDYSWDQFIELQRQMWYYHNNLKATHSYQSRPWQWIFNLRPVWMHVTYYPSGKVGNIYNLGNSVILISGLGAVLYTLRKERASWEKWFLLLCYFMIWLPWSFSPRIMLFYHYTPAVPLLCIALSRVLVHFFGGIDTMEAPPRHAKAIALTVICLSVIWFAVTFPHLTAIPVSKEFAEKVYFALPGWR